MFSQAMAETKKLGPDEEKRSGKPRCDHSNCCTEPYMWNGLTYCNRCCKHNIGHINFTMYLADKGPKTCTKCWTVVGPGIIGFRLKPIKRKWNKLNIPKIVLTNCEGKDTHITRIYTKKKKKMNQDQTNHFFKKWLFVVIDFLVPKFRVELWCCWWLMLLL